MWPLKNATERFTKCQYVKNVLRDSKRKSMEIYFNTPKDLWEQKPHTLTLTLTDQIKETEFLQSRTECESFEWWSSKHTYTHIYIDFLRKMSAWTHTVEAGVNPALFWAWRSCLEASHFSPKSATYLWSFLLYYYSHYDYYCYNFCCCNL